MPISVLYVNVKNGVHFGPFFSDPKQGEAWGRENDSDMLAQFELADFLDQLIKQGFLESLLDDYLKEMINNLRRTSKFKEN